MKVALLDYLKDKFPNLEHEVHIRFELGEPFENGTDERLNQVYYRVTTIFESLFNDDDKVYLLIKDWQEDDFMYGNTTPDYIYQLLNNQSIESELITETIEDEDTSGNHIVVESKIKQSILFTRISCIKYKEILVGIANYEQGREPSIGQKVYFIDTKRNIIFHMYDDRGCIVFADSTDKIRYLYKQYNNWIVDYWRSDIDQLFRNNE